MNENPIRMLTDVLADMTARVIEAEKDLTEEHGRAEAWYKACIEARDKCAGLEAKLDAADEQYAQAMNELKAEQDAHVETWHRCKKVMEMAVEAGVSQEAIEALIYSEGGTEDAE